MIKYCIRLIYILYSMWELFSNWVRVSFIWQMFLSKANYIDSSELAFEGFLVAFYDCREGKF